MNQSTLEQNKGPAPALAADAAISSAISATGKVPKSQEILMQDTRPETPGDRFYDIAQFLIGKVFILAATAVLAFTAHREYGPDKIGKVPNYLKKLQVWTENKCKPLLEKGDLGKILFGGFTSTLILSWGGNAFAPFIKALENRRLGITNWYNKNFATPKDVEIAYEKHHDLPKQNWNDVIKGRIMAYTTVWASISGAYLAFGRAKNPLHHFKLDTYEEWVGRKLTWLNKKTWDIAKTPMDRALSATQKSNKLYRFGKVLAIDLFATSAGIVVWNTVSRLSARRRVKEEKEEQRRLHAAEITTALPEPQESRFTDKIQPRATEPVKTFDADNYTDLVSQQRLAEENKTPALST